MMQLSLTLDDSVLQEVLSRWQAALDDPSDLLASIGETLLNRNQDRHRREVDPEGNPWEPLKASAPATKRSQRMLFESGDMSRFVYQVTGDAVQIGTVDHKAIWHHGGTDPYVIRPKHKQALAFNGGYFGRVNHPGLPARPLLGLPEEDEQAVQSAVLVRT